LALLDLKTDNFEKFTVDGKLNYLKIYVTVL